MDGFSNLLAVAIVSLLAAISPGPDFCIVLRNSLSYSRKAGLMTSLGICTALIVHLAYTLIGIGILIAESPLVYNILKYAGVAYLFYLGWGCLRSSFKQSANIGVEYSVSDQQISSFKAFSQGMLTNLLNPKCALFFISLFSQFIDPSTAGIVRLEYALVNWAVSLGWFVFLVCMVTAKAFLGRINTFRLYIYRIMGSALMFLGLKLLFV